jgi:hypothetical protein
MLRHGGGVEGRYEKVVYSSSESIYVYSKSNCVSIYLSDDYQGGIP